MSDQLTTEDVREIVGEEAEKLQQSFDRMQRSLESKLDSAIMQLSGRVDGHHRTLYGTEGRGGVVTDVELLKSADLRRDGSEKALKGWLATALLSALGALGSALWVLLFGRHP